MRNHNPYSKERQYKRQKDKHWFTKYDKENPTKNGNELRYVHKG